MTDISAFATRQIALLQKELQAELDETQLLTSTHAPTVLQRAGLAILNLTVSSQRTGLGGKTVLELNLDSAVGGGELPEHGLRVGDICSVAEQPKGSERKKDREGMEKKGADGVITKVQKETITVALDKEDADVPSGAGKLWLLKLANDITHKRLNQTMLKLQKLSPSEQTSLTQVLFGISSPTPISPSDLDPATIKFNDPSLNLSQQSAIAFALASREIALIHGPPGTGKTHTLIELILQLVSRGKRLLVCGPSNISVDNIVERLAPHKIPIVRVGHPARLLPSVLNHSLEVLTKTSEAAGIVADVRREMDEKQASIRKTRSGGERRKIYGEMKELRREFREREGRVVRDLVAGSKVVLATLHGAGGWNLKGERFDVLIVDEASQALEAQCWVPVLSTGAEKLVLAGDHLQLPPTIKSLNMKETKAKKETTPKKKNPTEKNGEHDDVSQAAEAAKDLSIDEKEDNLKENGQEKTSPATAKKSKPAKEAPITLETTLFDRLLALHGDSIKRMLTTQYRMHEKIMSFPSQSLYDSRLIAADAVKARLLKDLSSYPVDDTEDTREPLVFCDTQGGDFPEQAEDDEADGGLKKKKKKGSLLAESKVNPNEALVVRKHVASLVDAGVKAEDIAVITPYNGQLALLAQMLKEEFVGIELGSVDGFQGREKEAVIVSLVRSNDEGEVGFLAERRRLNVAMTRPKRHLCVVGDSDTVSKGSNFLKSWMEFLEENADLRYDDITELQND